MNSTVDDPPVATESRASSIASRSSLTPLVTALSCRNRAPISSASSRASVVFPAPGGPYRMIDPSRSTFEQPPQQPPVAQQLLLPDELAERTRPHPRRQRRDAIEVGLLTGGKEGHACMEVRGE